MDDVPVAHPVSLSPSLLSKTDRKLGPAYEIKFLLTDREGREILDRLRTVRGPGFERQEGWVTTVYFDRPDRLLTRRAIAWPSISASCSSRPEGWPSLPFAGPSLPRLSPTKRPTGSGTAVEPRLDVSWASSDDDDLRTLGHCWPSDHDAERLLQ